MAVNPTHYELLGISEEASDTEIKSAFRREAKRQHPDQGGNPVVFRMVEDAYEVLINPERRSDYDAEMQSGERTPPGGVRVDPAEYGYGTPQGDWYDDAEPTDYQAGANDTDAVFTNGTTSQGGPPRFSSEKNPGLKDLPDWFPRTKIKRRLVLFLIAAYLGTALLLTGQVIPGLDNGAVAVLVIWLVALYFLGSFLLRILGWTILMWSLIDLMTGAADLATTAIRCAVAVTVWLAGQWFYTYRQGRWRSHMAYRLLRRLPPRLRPDRRWMFTSGLRP